MLVRPAIAALAATAAIQVAVAGAPVPADAQRAPSVRQMVVFRSGVARTASLRAAATVVSVRGRRCGVGAGTPLAALVRARPARLRLRDFGACSGRAADGSGLFVSAIGRDVNRGRNGWVYKVGTRAATAGAGDPAGPFGRGRLRARARVTWFYCRYEGAARGCQRTLTLTIVPVSGGVVARVRAYDDRGLAVPAAGAAVHAGAVDATADAGGVARLALAPGRHRLYAEQPGLVRSFSEAVEVR